MAVSGRRRLALEGATGAVAVVWQKLVAKVTRKPTPLATTVLMHRFDSFVTWHDRPKSVDLRGPISGAPPLPQTAIVIQGLVIRESDYTLESVHTYRAHYPQVPVYVSTWTDTDPALLAALEAAGAVVVTSDVPDSPGEHNINMQITSARAGVERARSDGARFVAKTRTDQRLYSPKALHLLHALLEQFPIVDGGTQQARIVTMDYFTSRHLLYHAGDMLTFGLADDVLTYWSAPLDPRQPAEVLGLPNGTAREISECHITETYICEHFLAATGWRTAGDLADWWRALASRFVVVDAASLDLGWPRHTLREFRFRDYTGRSTFELMTFADWLPLAMNPTLAGVYVPEERLDEPRWP